MRSIALDTNIAVDVLNGKTAVLELLRQFDTIYLPVTVCGELLFGTKNSANRVRNEARYQAFINSCALLDTNALVAETLRRSSTHFKIEGPAHP